jgi:hypothetical protein
VCQSKKVRTSASDIIPTQKIQSDNQPQPEYSPINQNVWLSV